MHSSSRLRTWVASLAVVALLAVLVVPSDAHGPIHDRIRALDIAIQQSPDSGSLFLERAELERIDENPAAARRDIDQAARLDPGLPRLALCRAALALDEGDPDRALVDAGAYLNRYPLDRDALALRARIHDALDHARAAAIDRERLAMLEAEPRPGTTVATGAPTVTFAPPVLTRGPYLQATGTDRTTVRWRTDTAVDSRVTWGLTAPSQPNNVTDATLTTEHVITLTGLPSDTRVFYSIGTATLRLAGGDASTAFTTAPVTPSHPTRIWILGDSGDPAGSDDVRNGWLAYAGGQPPDFWLMLGDNAYNSGTDAEFQAAVFNVYPTILRGSTLWPTRGNHDAFWPAPTLNYYDHFTMPTAGECGGAPSGTEAWYSFDWGNAHFICLDSEGSNRSPGSPMLTWLATDLAASHKTWTIAFWHHPPYSKGSHDSDNPDDSGGRMRDMRENVLPVLESAGVDLVLTGHSHSYERSCLLDEHYGQSTSLDDSMKVDPGDGQENGDGPYVKPTPGSAAPHEGEVHIVAGASSRLIAGALNHPAMVAGLNVLGSVDLTIDGLRLDARYIDTSGNVRDEFTIIKGAVGSVAENPLDPIEAPRLLPGAPNPATTTCRLTFRLPAAGEARVAIFDARGSLVRSLADGPWSAGEHHLDWDTRNGAGQPVPAGLYMVRIVTLNGVRTQKVMVRR